MHLIDEDHIDWVWHFGIPSGRDVDKLSGLTTSTSVTGSPILTGALAWLDLPSRSTNGYRRPHRLPRRGARRAQGPIGDPVNIQTPAGTGASRQAPAIETDMEHDIDIDRNAILEWRQKVILKGVPRLEESALIGEALLATKAPKVRKSILRSDSPIGWTLNLFLCAFLCFLWPFGIGR